MKKLVVTLNIGDYLPEITELTYPFMQNWAKKIGAEWSEIAERRLTTEDDKRPPNYEKFQLHEISKHYDWTYFLDSDALVHPDTPDWAEMVNDKSVVIFNGLDSRLIRFRASNYSRRSRSQVGCCTWNVIASDWTGPDLWSPPENFEVAVQNIQPIWGELKTGQCHREHLIDDYQLSENIARYGLKTVTIADLCTQHIKAPSWFYTHSYNCSPRDKLLAIRRRLDEDGIAYP